MQGLLIATKDRLVLFKDIFYNPATSSVTHSPTQEKQLLIKKLKLGENLISLQLSALAEACLHVHPYVAALREKDWKVVLVTNLIVYTKRHNFMLLVNTIKVRL